MLNSILQLPTSKTIASREIMNFSKLATLNLSTRCFLPGNYLGLNCNFSSDISTCTNVKSTTMIMIKVTMKYNTYHEVRISNVLADGGTNTGRCVGSQCPLESGHQRRYAQKRLI